MKAKRFLALILALVMALSLVACGDSGKTPAADGDSNSDGDSSFPQDDMDRRYLRRRGLQL